MKLKNTIIILSFIMICGLAIRTLAIINHGPAPSYESSPAMDEVNYRQLAENILYFHEYGAWSEGFFTRSTRAPTYPLALASAYRLSNFNPWAPLVLNLFLDALNIFLIFLFAKLLYGARAGLVSSGIYSVFGPVFIYIDYSTPEIFSVALLLSICICFANSRRAYWLSVFPLSFLYAALIHSRPVFLLLIPFVGIIQFFIMTREKTKKRILKSFLPMALVAMLCVPWAWRNYKTHGVIAPVCTIAGWHIATRGEKLSIDDIINYVYRPEHKNKTEGEFYKDSFDMFCKDAFRNPFKIFFYGSLRVLVGWSFPRAYIRIFQPKAYFVPVRIFRSAILPLPDFEGIVYIFLILTVVNFFRKGFKKSWRETKLWGKLSLPFIILLAAYAAAHIPGIPLIQYRFIMEPLAVVLMVGLAFCYYARYRFSTVCWKWEIYAPVFISIFLGVFLIVPFLWESKAELVTYPKLKSSSGYLTYSQLRNMQWENSGNLEKDTKGEFCGIVKYPKKGLKFKSGTVSAEKAKGALVAKLFVRKLDEEDFRGKGDIKLNFEKAPFPKNDSAICVKGKASVGKFKDIIVDVESWKKLNAAE